MLRRSLSFVFAGALLLPAAAFAQSLELPAPSPAAMVKQRVGLTDITIEYSSPGLAGRAGKIWGTLVPWDKPWRTGANARTKITFSKDATFGGKPVTAGTYAVIATPGQKGWTVGLTKDLGPWSDKYDAKDEVVRVPATTADVPLRERMTFLFADTTDTDTQLQIEWDKLRIAVPIHVDTQAHAKANIAAVTDSAWRPLAQAARYNSEVLGDHATAQKLADQSVGLQATWLNHWIRAQIASRQNKWDAARKDAAAALELGNKDANFYYRESVEKAVKEWKDKK